MTKLIRLIVLIAMSTLCNYEPNLTNHSSNHNSEQKWGKYILMTIMSINNFNAVIFKLMILETESCHKLYLQKTRNRIMHAKFGNKSTKIKKHITIGQLNKGLSNYSTSKDLVVSHILKESPDILTLGEANINANEPNINKDIENYNIEKKFLKEQENARVAVFLKDNILYERLSKYENEKNAMIVLKIRLGKKKSLHLVCV